MGNEQGRPLSPDEIKSRENLNVIDGELKRKLNSKTIKYNLKLVIKGDRNTGKTSLFHRLQGLTFSTDYNPTPEIQISHINWNYKNTDDIVDVEVWDVVDVAKRSNKKDLIIGNNTKGNNTTNNTDDGEENLDSFYNDFDPKKYDLNSKNRSGSFKFQNLDAQTLDVYKNCNAVIFMVDPSKKWTFTYVEKEIKNINNGIFILLVTNFRDKNPIGVGEKNSVLSLSDIESFCSQRDNIYHIEASMLNAYGLKAIVNFFNIPFLYAQRASLQKQLERNAIEIQTATEETNIVLKEQNYDSFIKNIELRKSQQQQQQPQQQQQIQPNQASQSNTSSPTNTLKTSPINNTTQSPPTQSNSNINNSDGGGFFSRFTKSIGINVGSNNQTSPIQTNIQQTNIPKSIQPGKINSVDDFVVGKESSMIVGDDDDFYNEKPKSKVEALKQFVQPNKTNDDKFGDDSDDDNFNPLVAKNEDDDDDEDFKPIQKISKIVSIKATNNTQKINKEETSKTTPIKTPEVKPVLSSPKSIPTKIAEVKPVHSSPKSTPTKTPEVNPVHSSPKTIPTKIQEVKPVPSPPTTITNNKVSSISIPSPGSSPVKPNSIKPTIEIKKSKIQQITSPITKVSSSPKQEEKNGYKGFGDDSSDEEDNPFVTKDDSDDDDSFKYQTILPNKKLVQPKQPEVPKVSQILDNDELDNIPPPPTTSDNLDNWLDD